MLGRALRPRRLTELLKAASDQDDRWAKVAAA